MFRDGGPARESKHASAESKTVSPDWHLLEGSWCASRYALVDLHAGNRPGIPGRCANRVLPDYTAMGNEIARVFSNRWLPGRVILKSRERGSQGVSSFLNRKFVMPKENGDKRKRWTQEMKHRDGQRAARAMRIEQWNVAAGLAKESLGLSRPPCKPGGSGMVMMAMEGLERQGAAVDVDMAESELAREIAIAICERRALSDETQAAPRNRPRSGGAFLPETVGESAWDY